MGHDNRNPINLYWNKKHIYRKKHHTNTKNRTDELLYTHSLALWSKSKDHDRISYEKDIDDAKCGYIGVSSEYPERIMLQTKKYSHELSNNKILNS